MKFTYEGRIYTITFKRDYRIVPSPELGPGACTCSKFPYTTATLDVCETDPVTGRLMVVEPSWRTATVGCWHREPTFSSEKGRVRALRLITMTIPPAMKPLMWAAYTDRFNRLPKVR